MAARRLWLTALAFAGIGANAEAAEVKCAPALPVFCANVHVGCAGRTAVATHGFKITLSGSDALIAFADGRNWVADVTSSSSGAVYRQRGSRDWIRIDPKGFFSQRVYRARGPMMSYGTCR